MKCEHCGNEQASGKFCAACGNPFESARCTRCEAALLPGARFCTQCGQGVRQGRAMLPWYIAGGALVALVVALLWPGLPAGEPRTLSGPVGVSPPAGGSPPPLSGSMRENADRLFNRIMEARERADSAEATRFLPMAITAYQNAGELDDDGLYHLSLLGAEPESPARPGGCRFCGARQRR
jgi:hypothetical protein